MIVRLSIRCRHPPSPGEKTHGDVETALADGAKSFGELMVAVGSRDGREIVRALDDLRKAGRLSRIEDGLYELTDE